MKCNVFKIKFKREDTRKKLLMDISVIFFLWKFEKKKRKKNLIKYIFAEKLK
jgi:hypothetical protein